MKRDSQHSQTHPALEEHCWSSDWHSFETGKAVKSPRPDTQTEGPNERQQSQWLRLARQAKYGKQKATSTGIRGGRLTSKERLCKDGRTKTAAALGGLSWVESLLVIAQTEERERVSDRETR